MNAGGLNIVAILLTAAGLAQGPAWTPSNW
jgi:hypothetical protein